MPNHIVIIGGATEDIAFKVSDYLLIEPKHNLKHRKMLAFEYGCKIPINETYISFGGGAANVSATLASFGLKASPIIACGDDIRGQRIIDNLKKWGIDTKHVKKIPKVFSGFSFIIIGRGNEHIVFSSRGANEFLSLTSKDLDLIKKADALYLSSLSGRHWLDILDQTFLVGKKIFWNPGVIQINAGLKKLARYLKLTHVLLLNKQEANDLVISDHQNLRRGKVFLDKTENLLKLIYNWGPKIIVITEGQQGAMAYDGKKIFYQKVFKPKRKLDTTGVGDAFASALIAGLINDPTNLQRAMKLGAANAASVVSERGAQNGILRGYQIKF